MAVKKNIYDEVDDPYAEFYSGDNAVAGTQPPTGNQTPTPNSDVLPVNADPYLGPTPMPEALPPQDTPPPPVAQATPAPGPQFDPPATAPTATADPFASIGGGVQTADGGWVPAGYPNAPAPAPAPAQGGTTSSTTSTSSSVSSPAAMDAAVREAILQGLKTSVNPDPAQVNAHPAAQAARLSLQRSSERDRRQLAERASVEGWSDSGAVDSELNKIKERRGIGEMQFVGNLATQQLQDNRQFLLQNLALAQGEGQFEKAQSLQRELAAIDAALRDKGINVAAGGASDRLGFDYTALQLQANRDALIQALYGGA